MALTIAWLLVAHDRMAREKETALRNGIAKDGRV
jgi:hypothetical protein